MPHTDPPADFLAALHSLRDAPLPSGLVRREVPAPPALAPFSVAIGVDTPAPEDETPAASSTLVILHDPSQRDIWDGDFRLVGHLRAQIDAEMSADPVVSEYFWVSLLDHLTQRTTDFSGAMGTVTKELSQTFGGLTLRGSTLSVELRCSWSTDGPTLGEHLLAWSEYVLESAGFPSDMNHGLEVHQNA